tara:strand:- start:273 stop:419 length:147 start_codon:yes stop_codon:yes gene_type:complete
MKKIYIILFFFLGCSQLEFPWVKITFSEAQMRAIDSNKIVMVDFYADW